MPPRNPRDEKDQRGKAGLTNSGGFHQTIASALAYITPTQTLPHQGEGSSVNKLRLTTRLTRGGGGGERGAAVAELG